MANHHGRGLICVGYFIGGMLAIGGGVTRFFALYVARFLAAHSSNPWTNEQWLPGVIDVAWMAAGFGMALLLLTFHHHFETPRAVALGGFEPVNVSGKRH